MNKISFTTMATPDWEKLLESLLGEINEKR